MKNTFDSLEFQPSPPAVLKIILVAFACIMALNTSAQFTKVLDFSAATGGQTWAAPFYDGTFLYGMTLQGGANDYGTIFKVKPDGTGFVKLLDFDGVNNGRAPYGSSFVSDGTFLYGLTTHGGVDDFGTLFKIKPDGTSYAKLLDFDGASIGGTPYGSLILDGTFLYAMTWRGGTTDFGTIFKIKTDGTSYAKLHDFGIAGDGRAPQGSLYSDGTFLYGATNAGGANGQGTLFKIMPDGTGYSKFFDFAGTSNGSFPDGSLISDGTFLYGMTTVGGTNNLGTAFKILPDGTGYLKLIDFTGTVNGSRPHGDLIYDGTFLYGLTEQGGASFRGTLFRIKPDGSEYFKMFDFENGASTGANPFGSLISDGTFFYGMTFLGGVSDVGTVFKHTIAPATPVITSFAPVSGLVGTTITITGANFNTIPANMEVRFNGTLATVTASTSTSITTTVPAGATSGPITVTILGNTGASATSYTVTTATITITTHPSNSSDCNGTIATKTAAATGTTGIIYQWQTSSLFAGPYNDITDGGGYSNATTATLSVNTLGIFGEGYYRCKISGDNASTVFTNRGFLNVESTGAPTTTGAAACGSSSVVLTASGGSEGFYRWYTVDAGGTSIPGESNSTYTTPILTSSTTYYVTNDPGDGDCESLRTPVIAQIDPPSAPPVTTGASACGPSSLTLSVSGATDGQYRWYTTLVGGSAIAGEVNSSYVTPILPSSTDFFVAINNGTCETARVVVTAQINALPSSPTTTGAASCGPSSLIITASGATNGQYRWYNVSTGGLPITGEVNSSYTTPLISSSTDFFVAINDGTCESSRTIVRAQINPLPSSPTTTGAAGCGPSSLIITASGATNGQYRWYNVSTGGLPITGEVNSSYTTPLISSSTDFFVATNDGTCESSRTIVRAQINSLPSSPTTTGAASCGPSSLALTASGGTNGEYRWYNASTGGPPIAGEVNSSYTTPLISSTTDFFVAINNGTCESARTVVSGLINTIPLPPATTPVASCGPSFLTLTASGASNGQYRWYSVPAGGLPIPAEVNDTYVTPLISNDVTYHVAIHNGTCESSRAPLNIKINPVPAPPIAGSTTACLPSAVTLTASGAADGQYRWYTADAGGSAIAGEVNTNYVTPLLNSVTTYYVSVNNGTCESSRTPVVADVTVCTANSPPAIASSAIVVEIEGKVTLDLVALLSDPDNNLDLSTLKITQQPESTAIAFIDDSNNLIIDYSGISFAGLDRVTIEVCDQAASCTEQEITIEVNGDIIVYTGISPNGDGRNDQWVIRNIGYIPETMFNRVTIFNRWGDVVFEMENYDNVNRVFAGLNTNGAELPPGTYFYKIEFSSGRKLQTGYLSLKR